MPPIAGHNEHQWTRFELNTMLALMARGIHLDENPSPSSNTKSKRRSYSTSKSSSTSNAYLTFATALNHALHGDRYQEDISRREVTRQLDKMLKDKKQVVGRGGLMERQRTGRITRSLRCAWESNRKASSDGSLGEKRQREVALGFGGDPRSDAVPDMVRSSHTSAGHVQKKPSRNLAVVGKMGRYKSAAVVLDDGDEDGDAVGATAYAEMLIPDSIGYSSSPLHVTTTTTASLRNVTSNYAYAPTSDIDIPTPGLTHDHSSPQEEHAVPSPEERGSEQLGAMPGLVLGKAARAVNVDADVDVVIDDDVARDLEEDLFVSAESGV